MTAEYWADKIYEAADEIERLRAERDALMSKAFRVSAAYDALQAERDRLRAERAELRKLLVGLGAGIPAAAILRAEDR
jgi:uncharacterized coiled-coil DUF342 family protein